MDPFVVRQADSDDSNLFLSNLLSTLPNLDGLQSKSVHNENTMNGNSLFSNILDPFNGRSNNSFSFGLDPSNPIDIFGARSENTKTRNISPSTSPHTSSSRSSSASVDLCGHCGHNAVQRCLDCNDVFCTDCVNEHSMNSFTQQHALVGLGSPPPPIGSMNMADRNVSISIMQSANHRSLNEPQCESHGETLRFMCETCKKIVCQECTLKDHREHVQTPISNITAEKAKEKLKAIHESSKLGIKFIKNSIDRAVTYSQSIERDSLDISSKVKKAFRLMILAAEDRERTLLEQVDKYRQQKVANLGDQMTGLRSALAGLAETSELLGKSVDSINDNTSKIDIAFLLANTENQIEKYAAMYKNLQPKEENLNFIQPSFELLQDLRNQGEVVINSRNNNFQQNANPSNGNSQQIQQSLSSSASSILKQRQQQMTPSSGEQVLWDSNNEASSVGNSPQVTAAKTTYASIVKPAAQISGQCIPGSKCHISVKPSIAPTLSFCFDGHEDGEVSRPWGVCVTKNNEVIIADRRNNRIQVFFCDGSFKFKFGSKGTGNGQFDLPAGVASDQNNRIIVVDKDNHRIQVFSANGVFINKFGSYGKELSQFMYPWAVAVNNKSQILVTDSRNHRIQLFSQDGHFISRFSFDGLNHSRYLKGLTTPRGVCFNPQGNIIISDFENHRLILIDSSMTKILATKGHEGSALHEFCRPSGICCDDDGRIIVADSKNQRVLIFSPMLEFLWTVEIRPSSHNILTANMDEKDRPSDVALLNDGRLVVLVETSPDSREVISPHKTFVQIY